MLFIPHIFLQSIF